MIVNNPNISPEEFEKLKHAIAEITLLIAGADGVIENKELAWAEKITKIRSYNLPDNLKAFYQEVGKDYALYLDHLIESYPADVQVRQEAIVHKLEALNPILAKLHPKEGAELYESYVSFAHHVAKASGGFLGFFAVKYAEKELMELPMLNPIAYYDEEE